MGKEMAKEMLLWVEHRPNLTMFSFVGKQLNTANSAPGVYPAGLYCILYGMIVSDNIASLVVVAQLLFSNPI